MATPTQPVKIPTDMHREIKTICAIDKKYMGEYLETVYKEWKEFKAKEKFISKK